ncbi:UNVERIFIED_CONTAM: hypothetical protein K2H54_066142 [Gekko kuhli]
MASAERAPSPLGAGGAGGAGSDPPGAAARGARGFLRPPGGEVHVSGAAELSAGPDRAEVTLRLRSEKPEACAARGSVTRRLDYVAQTARQRGGLASLIPA